MLEVRLQNTIHVQNRNIVTIGGAVWNPIRIMPRQEWRVIARARTHTDLI